MFQTAIRRPVPRLLHTGASASALATRKHTDPSASGAHTRTSCSWTLSVSSSAANVVTLKKIVPTNWTTAAHQSSRSTRGVCLSWRSEAEVKKIDPAKKVAPTTSEGTRSG